MSQVFAYFDRDVHAGTLLWWTAVHQYIDLHERGV